MKTANKPATPGQAREMISRFATQVPWAGIESDFLQEEFIRLSPTAFAEKFLQFFSARAPREPFRILQGIKLGTGLKNADDFCGALSKAGCNVSESGRDLLGKHTFSASAEEAEIDLVIVSNAELGLKDGAKLKDTYLRAFEYGLELCPNEVGPQLLLQYQAQSRGEWLLVAMVPIIGSDENSSVFEVGRNGDGERWLVGNDGDPCDFHGADRRFIFKRRR